MIEYYACSKHIDYVIEDFINKYESFPILNVSEEKKYCNYCDDYAIYTISKN